MQTGLPKKMLLKPGYRLLALNAPEGFVAANLADLPDGATVTGITTSEPFDAVVLFAKDVAALTAALPHALTALVPGGLLWVGFPKGESKRQADLTRDRGWGLVVEAGYEFCSLISLDSIWSGWRFRQIAAGKTKARTRMTEMTAQQTTTPTSAAKVQFDRQAGKYNERWASWSDETLQRMLDLAQPQPTWQVLDVATGTGFTALAFAKHVDHVTGADLSPGMLAQADARAREQGVANVDWVEAAAEALPFADGTFDLVTVRIAPHHFADVSAFLRETRRVLKPGGAFVLGDTTVPGDDKEAADWQNAVEKERDPSHNENLSPERWNKLAAEAGLTVTDLEYGAGRITIPLTQWLDTSGATGERAARVRQMFAEAPESARRHFRIETATDGETRFSWARVLLRAIV
jgi:ubiquinone/menaquinone biosynthesis C-methylase UbiE